MLVVPICWQLWIILQWTQEWRSLHKVVIPSLLGICPEDRWLDDMIVLFSFYLGISILLLIMTVPINIAYNSAQLFLSFFHTIGSICYHKWIWGNTMLLICISLMISIILNIFSHTWSSSLEKCLLRSFAHNFLFFFGWTGVLTQGFIFVKQALYHLSHISSAFCSGYFGNGVLWTISTGWSRTVILRISASPRS
jgi:hypothetical protein